MDILKFDEVVTSLQKKRRTMSLLMGNGFSMAYDKEIFSYNALYNFLQSQDDELLTKLFGAIKTKNFELVMQQLDTTIALLDVFGAEKSVKQQILEASEKLKQGLLKSVKELHPEHVYKISDAKSAACANFLRLFLDSAGQIFTTNYDLLLYWVLMRQGTAQHIDGFGRELENPLEVQRGEDEQWSDLIWGPNQSKQNIHYLHGALHLFDAGSEIIKEQYDWTGYLLDHITNRLDEGSYPIFVTAGNGKEKLEHIRHNRYLSYCYDRLSNTEGSLVTFGFNFGPYDDHIIEAINRAAKHGVKVPDKLWSVYIGTYSDADIKHIESILPKFEVKVQLFDAKTANVWEA